MSGLVNTILKEVDSLDSTATWARIEDSVFGPDHYHLRIQVIPNSKKWQSGWDQGLALYRRQLKPAARKNLDKAGTGSLPFAAMPDANRSAIQKSGCLISVAWAGPQLRTQDGQPNPREKEIMSLLGVESVSSSVREKMVSNEMGYFVFPLSEAPPADWVFSEEDVKKLLTSDIFVTKVADIRASLAEGDLEAEAEELGNSESGSTENSGSQD
jgi:hypothetical protein